MFVTVFLQQPLDVLHSRLFFPSAFSEVEAELEEF